MGGGRSKDSSCCFSGVASQRGNNAGHGGPPVVVAVSGAAGQIAYSLLPMIASGDMFGPGQQVILQCLDLNKPKVKSNMQGIKMELDDGNFPLLYKSIFVTDDAAAFKAANYAILIGAFPKKDGVTREEQFEKNTLIFRTMGRAIENYAHKNCKVLVVGNPSNTNALICSNYCKLPKENFFGFSHLDQNRTQNQIAQLVAAETDRAASGSDVQNVVMWGSGARIPDVEHATVHGRSLEQALPRSGQGPAKWQGEDFLKAIQSRGRDVHALRQASSQLSAARGIVQHMHALHCGTNPGQYVSMAVWSDKNPYGIADGIYFSMPVECQGGGKYSVHAGLTPSERTRSEMKVVEGELLEDRDLANHILKKYSSQHSQG